MVEASVPGFLTFPSILDGGLGTELLNSGVELERDLLGHARCVELLSVTRPELVLDVHKQFRAAGAQWLTTNTFCADSASLERNGLQGRGAELVAAAVSLCRQAARDGGFVFGSVGPGPGGAAPDAAATGAFLTRLVGSEGENGVDGLLIETQMEEATLLVLLEQAARVRAELRPELVLAVSLVVDSKGELPACQTLSEAQLLARLEDANIDLLSLNCSSGAAPLRPALTRLRSQWKARLGAYPNAGVPSLQTDGSTRHPIGPEQFARELLALQAEFRLDLIGGCCGASPAHISALSS